jgi:L-ascorbate metabolism protein UlaG (beta-lactamase superfamily)
VTALSITWLGHATFILLTPGGKRIVTDPWLEGNPACPADRKRIEKADVILLSHGHSDHSGDVVAVARATGAPVVTINELRLWLEQKGLQKVEGLNFGGTVSVAGLEITLVPAVHTSSVVENGVTVYLGEPAGFIVKLETGQRIYFAGDTARSCRSATTTRWAPMRRPGRARCSAFARSCPCTSAPSRS